MGRPDTLASTAVPLVASQAAMEEVEAMEEVTVVEEMAVVMAAGEMAVVRPVVDVAVCQVVATAMVMAMEVQVEAMGVGKVMVGQVGAMGALGAMAAHKLARRRCMPRGMRIPGGRFVLVC